MSEQPSPIPEMPPGTWRALVVVGVLLVLLIVQLLTVGAPPGTGLAVLADFLLGLVAATAGVWVLGGAFNVEGNVSGFSVKAAGGIALLFLVTFVLRLFYNAGGEVSGPVFVDLNEWTTIGPTLTRFQKEHDNNMPRAIDLQIASEIRPQIMAFRPLPPDREYSYRSTFWGAILENPRVSFLKDIEQRQACLSFEPRGEDGYVARLEFDGLEEAHKSFESGETVTVTYCSE
jgi:hypothetical protein